jgi:multidrug efflux pump subunit AcrA (membrane-fusion protein)
MDIVRPKRKAPWRRWGIYGGVALAIPLGLWAAIARAKDAAPVVERASLWIGTVHRGPMTREVKGPGVLAPEHIRFITAQTAGRVERIDARPGAEVAADTMLVELSNPDIALAALQSERDVASAQSTLLEKRSRLEEQELTERETVATLRGQSADADRRALAAQSGVGRVFTSLDAEQAEARAEEMSTRKSLAESRASIAGRTRRDEIAAQQTQVQKQRAVADFRREQLDALHVRAGGEGVVQELSLELGQWVTPGTVLAKVVRPDQLKAILRIPEALAKDVTSGQLAHVDTRNGIVNGHVTRVATAAHQGTVDVEVGFDGPLPKGARPDQTVDGTVEIEQLGEVLSMPLPVGAVPGASVGLFKVAADGEGAARVQVALGRESANAIEVNQGLNDGDHVILSDMARWDGSDRVRIR